MVWAAVECKQLCADSEGKDVHEDGGGGVVLLQSSNNLKRALFHLPGLWGTEVRGGGFSAGYELFGQIFISGGHQESETTAARSYVHVSSIQDEGNCAFNGGETLHLHRQFCPSRRTAGNWLVQTQCYIITLTVLWSAFIGGGEEGRVTWPEDGLAGYLVCQQYYDQMMSSG